jgi:hypothetical protein
VTNLGPSHDRGEDALGYTQHPVNVAVDLLWSCIASDSQRLAIGGRQSHSHYLVSGQLPAPSMGSTTSYHVSSPAMARLSSIIAVLKPFSSRYALSASRSASANSTRVCAYPPKFVLESQDPLFHDGDIIGRRVSGNQDQNLVRQDRSLRLRDNRLSSPNTATGWRGAI